MATELTHNVEQFQKSSFRFASPAHYQKSYDHAQTQLDAAPADLIKKQQAVEKMGFVL